MTRAELTEILGTKMIRSTKHPCVVTLRPRLLFGSDKAKLGRMVDAIIRGHSAAFFSPHEPWEIIGARYQSWENVEGNTWAVPSTATAEDVLNDPVYPYGWTLFAAAKSVTGREVRDGLKDNIAELGDLVDRGKIAAAVVTNPDGTPWLAAVISGERGLER